MTNEARKHIFVLGYDDAHAPYLRATPDSGRFEFHPLLHSDELVYLESYDIDEKLEDARKVLRESDVDPDAIICHWDFPVVSMLSILCVEFGLRAPTLKASLRCSHKYWSRLAQHEVVPGNTPGFCAFDPFDDQALEQISLNFPFWIKPIKGYGSALGFKITSGEGFGKAMGIVRERINRFGEGIDAILHHVDLPDEVASVQGNYMIAEQFVNGKKFAPEGRRKNGEYHSHGFFDMVRAESGKSFLRYEYPSRVPESVRKRADEISARGARTHRIRRRLLQRGVLLGPGRRPPLDHRDQSPHLTVPLRSVLEGGRHVQPRGGNTRRPRRRTTVREGRRPVPARGQVPLPALRQGRRGHHPRTLARGPGGIEVGSAGDPGEGQTRGRHAPLGTARRGRLQLRAGPMAAGTHLAGRMWLPADAAADPVPAILEYHPYRKRDIMRARDALVHPWLAARGYACIRVDLRGSGESQGVLTDQFRAQEFGDGLEVIRWIAARDWCDGNVGMMGLSWGGFNALQVAAERPPELKAIVTVCSTDDLYRDNMHYMGGCLLSDNLSEATTMFSVNTCPPDPVLVGEGQRTVARHLTATPMPRRILAARLGLRGLRRHRLHECAARRAAGDSAHRPRSSS